MTNEQMHIVDGAILAGPKDYKPTPTMPIPNIYEAVAEHPDDAKILAGGKAEKGQNKDKPNGHQNKENDINAPNTGNKKRNLLKS